MPLSHSAPSGLIVFAMAGDRAAGTARTPAKGSGPKPASASASSTKQRSIFSFFQKSSPGGAPASSPLSQKVSPDPHSSSRLKETSANSIQKPKPSTKLSTPVASSDALEPATSQENIDSTAVASTSPLPSPDTVRGKLSAPPSSGPVTGTSPTRKVRGTPSTLLAIIDVSAPGQEDGHVR